jgi:hypothetical protein
MGALVPVPFEQEGSPGKTTVVVTMQDGQKFEIQLALVVLGVADQGMANPLDGMPMFQVASQVVTRVSRRANG